MQFEWTRTLLFETFNEKVFSGSFGGSSTRPRLEQSTSDMILVVASDSSPYKQDVVAREFESDVP